MPKARFDDYTRWRNVSLSTRVSLDRSRAGTARIGLIRKAAMDVVVSRRTPRRSRGRSCCGGRPEGLAGRVLLNWKGMVKMSWKKSALAVISTLIATVMMSGPAFAATIFGTNGSDNIRGTAAADDIFARVGADTVRARNGDDTVRGGAGDDTVWGMRGRDDLFGGLGDDTLRGGGGADLLIGAAGADELRPGPGSDRVAAGRGNDTVYVQVDGNAQTPSKTDVINCGDGLDRVVLVDGQRDVRDRFRNCERFVTQ